MSKDQSPSVELLRDPSGRRRWIAVLAAVAALAACDSPEKRAVGTVGHVTGFGGLAAADEPRAALVGRDVLSAGGSAADAATAMYFTLAVTYPSAASLGGGGSCIVHDGGKKKTEVMEFPAIASVQAGGRPTGVPANPRGFFALHAKYGKLRHDSLLLEAERLARTGFPVSRALANDLARAVPILGRDPAARAIFFRPDGSVLREGDSLQQPQLAAVIANLRRATGDFYLGLGARDMVKAAQAAEGTLTLEDLRDIRPTWRDTISFRTGNEIAHFAPPPSVESAAAGLMIGALWERWGGVAAAERPHLLAETSARLFADRTRWMRPNGWSSDDATKILADQRVKGLLADYNPGKHVPVSGLSAPPNDNPSATGFVAMDENGQTVACALSTYGLFGAGRVAPGTGIVLAGAPGPGGPPPLALMLTVNAYTSEAKFAAAAAGGAAAPSALAQAYLLAAIDGKPLDEALAAPRVVHPGLPDMTFAEAAPYAADAAGLQSRGHQVSVTPMPSRIEALFCRQGYKNPKDCEVSTDPRGTGLASSVGKVKD